MHYNTKTCLKMARDIERIANVTAHLASGEVHAPGAGKPTIRGTVLGPDDGDVVYALRCVTPQKKGSFGPGTCGVYEITRNGPGVAAKGLKPKTTVGNLFGLGEQLARDATRLWGCIPERVSGFEGAKTGRRAKKGRR